MSKISAYTAATQPPGNGDVGVFDVGGATKKVTPAQMQGCIAQSAVQVSHTGDTAEFTFATVTIPAGMIGPNGTVLIEAMFSHTSNANTKTPRIKFGGTLVNGQAVTASTAASRFGTVIQNRNAQNSQVTWPALLLGPYFVGTSAAPLTMAIDTSAAVTITITGQLGTSTDTISLEAYRAVVTPGA